MHFTYTFANLISLKFFDSESIFFFTFMCSWTIWKIEVPLCVQFCWDFKWVLLNSKLLYHSWTNEKNFSVFFLQLGTYKDDKFEFFNCNQEFWKRLNVSKLTHSIDNKRQKIQSETTWLSYMNSELVIDVNSGWSW